MKSHLYRDTLFVSSHRRQSSFCFHKNGHMVSKRSQAVINLVQEPEAKQKHDKVVAECRRRRWHCTLVCMRLLQQSMIVKGHLLAQMGEPAARHNTTKPYTSNICNPYRRGVPVKISWLGTRASTPQCNSNRLGAYSSGYP